MSSRDKILNALKASKPELTPLADWIWESDSTDITGRFIKTLEGIGGHATVVNNVDEVKESLALLFDDKKRIVSTVPSLNWKRASEDLLHETAESLETIELTIVAGTVGVAENGAIWVDEKAMGHRALPFICQHLAIVLPVKDIVANMHDAYKRIDVTAHGFGAFIAGPSKTADIEQSLVIGAHGARSLRVFLLSSTF